jgi:hypothetical protein
LDDHFHFRNDRIMRKTKKGPLKKRPTKKGVWIIIIIRKITVL